MKSSSIIKFEKGSRMRKIGKARKLDSFIGVFLIILNLLISIVQTHQSSILQSNHQHQQLRSGTGSGEKISLNKRSSTPVSNDNNKNLNQSSTSKQQHSNNNATTTTTQDSKPWSQPCQEYYSANTDHAVCRGDRSVMCRSGCTGSVFAQNCQADENSLKTNQSCNVAFSKTSMTAFLCTTSQGAFTCSGPIEGQATCNNCMPTSNREGEENDDNRSSANRLVRSKFVLGVLELVLIGYLNIIL